MSAVYMGEIRVFGGTFAPQNWALCAGQTLAISQNDALFVLLGTTYGGDGVNTFNLPDARGRLPIGQGTGPGLTPRVLGQSYGAEAVTLSIANMPAHSHSVQVSATEANLSAPSGQMIGQNYHYLPSTTPPNSTGSLLASAVSSTGGSQPHDNMMPYLCLNFILCLQGIFPSRN